MTTSASTTSIGLPGGEHSGLLQRLSRTSSSPPLWCSLAHSFAHSRARELVQDVIYVKEGVFLKEEPRKLGTISGQSNPREIIDLTGADIEDTSNVINKPESYVVSWASCRCGVVPSALNKTQKTASPSSRAMATSTTFSHPTSSRRHAGWPSCVSDAPVRPSFSLHRTHP